MAKVIQTRVQDEAPNIAKLPYNWLNSMVYGRYNELVNDLMGVLLLFINPLTTGGPHPVWIKIKL